MFFLYIFLCFYSRDFSKIASNVTNLTTSAKSIVYVQNEALVKILNLDVYITTNTDVKSRLFLCSYSFFSIGPVTTCQNKLSHLTYKEEGIVNPVS
jgi:hypothetical protein